MEKYVVSARKYRPLNFSSVVGQKSLTETLRNSVLSGRLAHAYLFCGPRGVGKTTCARIFAKTINCSDLTPEGEACDRCPSCRMFNEQRSMNVHELDAASHNSVDDIRSLIEEVAVPPQTGRYRVFIIDEVHMLSTAAFNAFLKTLEEPPSHAIFILATTEKHKVLPTILSRCQIYDFMRMSVQDTVRHLEHVAECEHVQAEPSALNVIARKADGGMRDALSIFDQVVSYCNGCVTYKGVIEDLNVLDYDYFFRLTDHFLAADVPSCLLLFDEILSKGFQGDHFIAGLASHLRDLMVSHDKSTLPLLDVSDDIRERYVEQARKAPLKFIFHALRLCSECSLSYRQSQNKRLSVELVLIQCCQLCQKDEEPAGGPRPTEKIKPIFSSNPSPAAKAPQPAATQEKPQVKAEMPQQRPVPAPAKAVQAVPSQTPAKQAEQPRRRFEAMPPVIGFRISAPNAAAPARQEAAPVQKEEPETRKEEQAVDETAIQIAWNTFISGLTSKDAALKGRMESMTPKLCDGNVFEVVVQTQAIEQDMLSKKAEIERFIKDSCRNSSVSMRIRVASGEDGQHLMTDGEIFRDMMDRNPNLARLKDALDLSLL